MGVPAQTLRWIATGRKDDPAGIRTDGYNVGDLIPSFQHNWIFNNITEWQEHQKRAFGKTYYVNSATGDDGNDGSDTYPFQTVKKAVDSIEDGGFGSVIIKSGGTHEIVQDIDLIARNVMIVVDSTTNIKATSYIDTGDNNNLRGFNLYRGSSLVILSYKIEVGEPSDIAKPWASDASFIRVYDGMSYVGLGATNAILFSPTSASTTVYPSLVCTKLGYSIGIPILGIGGTITTNEKGYVINTFGQTSFLNNVGSIDNANYWIIGGLNQNQKFVSGTLSTALETFYFGVAKTEMTNEVTLSITPDDTTDSEISNTLAEYFNAIQNGITIDTGTPSADIGFSSTRDASGYITSMEIELKGVLGGYRLPSPIYYKGESEGWLLETQRPRRNRNVFSNIEGIN